MSLECHTVKRKLQEHLTTKKLKVTVSHSNERLRSDVFNRYLKMGSDGDAVMSDSRLFQT